MLIQAYFEGIKEVLLLELDQAAFSIKVVVAWFTDLELFNKLIEKAINNYSRCIEIDSSLIEPHKNRAVCYMNNGIYNQAVPDLLVITQQKDFCPEIHRFLGYCYFYLEMPEKSRMHFSISSDQGDVESKKILTNE